MNLKEIKEIALANVANPTVEYYYRYVCRWFSKNFSTPLFDVYSLPPYDVYLAYFEENYEKLAQSEDWEEQFLTEALRAIDPEFDEKEEESIQDFIKMLEDEIAEKKLNKKDVKKRQSSTVDNNQPSLPQSKPVVKSYNEPIVEEMKGTDTLGLDQLDKALGKDVLGEDR